MIKLMEASAEDLESVEGIDIGMAATIIETRETQQYIDLYSVRHHGPITLDPKRVIFATQPNGSLAVHAC